MKRSLFTLLLCFLVVPTFAQNDAEGCAEHRLIPSRIPGYFIGSCEVNDYSSHTVATSSGEKVVEGKKTVLQYFLRSDGKAVSETFIRKNYMDAMKKLGAAVQYEQYGRGVTQLIGPDRSEIWVDVAGYVGDGTPEESAHFYLTIIEIASMEQVITAKDLSDELRNTGKSVLYIQFETGKWAIKSESVPIIEQMAMALNADMSLRVYIVGHTDNVGSLEDNLKLSENRANEVVSLLVNQYNVPAVQLIARGVGPLSPVANNLSEEGRKMNRRVEMVRQ